MGNQKTGNGIYGLVLCYKNVRKEVYGRAETKSDYRAEMIAMLKGLEALKEPCKVDLYTTSKYISNAINYGLLWEWRNNKWIKQKKKVQNIAVWIKIIKQLERHYVLAHYTEHNDAVSVVAEQKLLKVQREGIE